MAGLEIPSIIVQDNGIEHGYNPLSPPSPRFRRKRPSRDNIDNLMQESLSVDDWNASDMEENCYEECDLTAGLGDATCDDSGHVAGSTGSTNSSPEQQRLSSQSTNFFGGSGTGGYRHKNSSKMKLLVRSHALREAASPPPDSPTPSSLSPAPESQPPMTKEGDNNQDEGAQEGLKVSSRPRVKQAGGSSQCSLDSSTSFVSFTLSRDSSAELVGGNGSHTYTDNTGVNLHHFIIETLHRNYKDRTTLLRIEQEMITLVRDAKRTCHRFPAMSSYHRMLVHRVAAYFGLEHNVDQSGNCVVVSKSVHTRIPDVPFKQYVREDVILPEEPSKKSNLRREAVSFEELHPNARYRSPENRSRSFEERESEPTRPTRNRVFHPQTSWSSSQEKDGSESAYTSSSHRTSHDDIRYSHPRKYTPQGILRTSRIPKVESFDSRELLCNYGNSLRPAVAKSYSFGGYTAAPPAGTDGAPALVRGESAPNGAVVVPNHSPKLLSKQDSNSSSISISRSSPTSSGYKSQQSVSAAPSPSPIMSRGSTSRQPQTASSSSSVESQPAPAAEWMSAPKQPDAPLDAPCGSTLLWAVTSLDAVPSGSILINPHTGQPFYNTDGSVYRYDPNQPLPFQMENGTEATCQTMMAADEMNMPQAQGGPEPLQSFDSYDETAVGKVELYSESSPLSVPIYPTWPPNYYDGAPATPAAGSASYGQNIQPFYSEFHPSLNNSNNGFYVAHLPQAAASDDPMKALTAVSLPHGQGYVVYQTCVAPPETLPASQAVENELNPILKNLSLRPIVPVPYPSLGLEGIPPATDISAAPSIYAVPMRAANPQLAKVSTGTSASGNGGAGGIRAPLSSATTSTTNSLMAPNTYMTSIRVHNSGHIMAPTTYATGNIAPAPYAAPVVYPLPNQTPPTQPNGQPHYISASVVHHYNNTPYVAQPRPLLLASPAASRCRTPDREGASAGDVAMTRIIHGSLPTNRYPFVYGSSLGTPVLPGDIRALRPPAFFRQYSLPTSSSQALYALRPRLQPQLTLAGPQVAHPNVVSMNNQGNVGLASRPPRMRRQSNSRNVASSSVASISTSTPSQSSSSSPVQQHSTSS